MAPWADDNLGKMLRNIRNASDILSRERKEKEMMKHEQMMKHGGKVLLLFAAALVVATGFTPQAWAQKATAESFAQKDQTIEYHFMLIEGDLTEKNMT